VEVAHDVPAPGANWIANFRHRCFRRAHAGESAWIFSSLPKEIAPQCFFLLITGVQPWNGHCAINSGADRYVIKDHELVDQLAAVREVSESLKWKKEAG